MASLSQRNKDLSQVKTQQQWPSAALSRSYHLRRDMLLLHLKLALNLYLSALITFQQPGSKRNCFAAMDSTKSHTQLQNFS